MENTNKFEMTANPYDILEKARFTKISSDIIHRYFVDTKADSTFHLKYTRYPHNYKSVFHKSHML